MLTIEHFFFKIQNYTMEGVINEEGFFKNQYIGELPKKGGLDSLLTQGGLGKKERGVFEGGG